MSSVLKSAGAEAEQSKDSLENYRRNVRWELIQQPSSIKSYFLN
jgi:hypothetical protein